MSNDLREKLLPVVAIHEAAHVIVGEHHDMPLQYVTLTPQPGKSWGHVKPVQRENGYHCHHIMPTYAAGAIAQDIATECKDRIVATHASGNDFAEIRHCARLVWQAARRGEDTGMDLPPRATVRKIAEVAWGDAYRIVTAQYGAILAVADALLHTSRVLTQLDCQRIMAAADTVAPPGIAHLAEQFWPTRFMPGWWVPESPRKTVAATLPKRGRR